MLGLDAVATQPKEIGDRAVDRQKALGVAHRLEPSHLSFPLSSWLVRDLRSIVHSLTLFVNNSGEKFFARCAITLELVGHNLPRCVAQALEQFLEKALGGLLVSTFLHQDIKYITILINGAPKIVTPTADADEYLVEKPRIAQLSLTAAK